MLVKLSRHITAWEIFSMFEKKRDCGRPKKSEKQILMIYGAGNFDKNGLSKMEIKPMVS